MTDRRRNIRAFLIFFAAIGMLVAMSLLARASDVIDMTINGDLADINPAQRVPISMHVWDLRDPDHLAYSVHWKDAEARAKAGQMVVLDIEPMQSPKPEWRRPTIPLAEFNGGKMVSIEDVRETHRLIGERLEPLCELALKSGAPVCDYMTYQVPSLEMWVSRHAEAVAVTEQLVKLTSWKGRSNVSRITETGGCIVVEIYVPTQWNKPNFWLQTKAVIAMHNLLACYERLGVRVMPLLYPYTVGGPEKEAVRPDLMNALILAARGRYGSRWGFYNESHPLPAGVKELLK